MVETTEKRIYVGWREMSRRGRGASKGTSPELRYRRLSKLGIKHSCQRNLEERDTEEPAALKITYLFFMD